MHRLDLSVRGIAAYLRSESFFRIVAVGLSVLFVSAFFAIIAYRLSFPYEIKAMEGATIVHVLQLLKFGTVYAPPSLSFIPNFYPPATYYTISLFFALFGVSFTVARAAALIFSLIALGSATVIAYRETGSAWLYGLLAAGLFSASYGKVGYFYDAIRVDAFQLGYLALGVYLAFYNREKIWRLLGSGLLLSLALYAKQHTVFFLPLLILWPTIESRARGSKGGGKRSLVLGLSLLTFSLCFYAYLQAVSHGWFLHYVWFEPQAKGNLYSMQNFFSGLIEALRRFGMPILLLGILLNKYRGKLIFSLTPQASRLAFLSGLYFIALFSAAFGFGNSGGDRNVMLPLAFGCSVLLPILLYRAKLIAPIKRTALLIASFFLLSYNPFWSNANLPPARIRASQAALYERIVSSDTLFYFPQHAYLTLSAGKRQLAEFSGMDDAILLQDSSGKRIEREWDSLLRTGTIDIIVRDDSVAPPHYRLSRHYPTPFGFSYSGGPELFEFTADSAH